MCVAVHFWYSCIAYFKSKYRTRPFWFYSANALTFTHLPSDSGWCYVLKALNSFVTWNFPPQPRAGTGPCWGSELDQQWSKTQMNRRELLSIFRITEWRCVRLSKRFSKNNNSLSSLAMLCSLTPEITIKIINCSSLDWFRLFLSVLVFGCSILLFRTDDNPSESDCLICTLFERWKHNNREWLFTTAVQI